MDTSEIAVTSNNGQSPVHTIRRGAIAVSIWRRQSQAGTEYFDFSISRSWKSQDTDREGYSSSFFSRNVPELTEVITLASAWIDDQEKADNTPAVGVPIARIQPVKVPASEAIS